MSRRLISFACHGGHMTLKLSEAASRACDSAEKCLSA
jgi:hypothetical protein